MKKQTNTKINCKRRRGTRKHRAQEQGITLIALVITIIVLLILAGVTIAMIVGDNGILTRAKEAKKETEEAETKEKIELAVAGAYGVDGYDVEKINSELGTNISSLPAIINQNGKTYTISKSGKVYEGKSLTGQITSENYGDKIKYDCGIDINKDGDSTNDWRIFYNDGENVYIIADDYIHFDDAPVGKEGTELYINDKGSGVGDNYQLSMNNVYEDYNGAEDIDSRLRKWLSYLNSYGDSTYRNMRAIAYILDTNAWNSYANDKAEYAVGGPTLDMFCSSYNEKHTPQIEYRVGKNGYGYEVKLNNSNEWVYWIRNALDATDDLYVKTNRTKAYAMWLASPGALNEGNMFYVGYDGSLYGHGNYDYNATGFRPLVCLKSNIQATKEGDVWEFQD